MANPGPVLVGVEGIAAGERFPLEQGRPVIIGRSRSCDISLRRCRRWLEAEEAGQPLESLGKTVSRKHLKVRFAAPDSIELEDLSSNGTFVDGKRIDRAVITDAKSRPHEILLGAGQRFLLEWR